MKKFTYQELRTYIPRWLEIIFGIIFVILGIAGLVLPFLQGFLFIIIGVALISPHHGKKLATRFKRYGRILKNKYDQKSADKSPPNNNLSPKQ